MPDVREKLVELRGVLGKSVCWGYDDITDIDYIDYEGTARNLLANGVTIQRWIPVTERLPDNLQTVLCYTNFDEVRMWQWNERWKSWIRLVADYGKNVVTHWMPLPDAPKGD